MAQQRIRHLFPGSNTACGFVGFFENLRREARRTVILKGGPGVGKSTLMKEAGRRYEERGQRVEYYACSGDPDSLDAVFAVESGFLMLDGTAPHIVDPRLPGAKDGILNLGVCLDEGQMTEQAGEIGGLTEEIAACFANAYRYLAAADQCRRDAAAVYEAAYPAERQRQLLGELRALAGREDAGGERRCFAQAITWKGVLQQVDSILTDRTVCLDAPWGFDASVLLEPLRQEAAWEGQARWVYHDPLDAAKISHLMAGGTVFTTAVLMDAMVFRPQFDLAALRREAQRLSFDRAAHDLLLNQAVEALAEAKQKHDALERYYIDAMDYDRLDELKAEALERLP